MDIILLFLAKPLDKHGTTLVRITYLPLLYLWTKILTSLQNTIRQLVVNNSFSSTVAMEKIRSSSSLLTRTSSSWLSPPLGSWMALSKLLLSCSSNFTPSTVALPIEYHHAFMPFYQTTSHIHNFLRNSKTTSAHLSTYKSHG